MDSVSASLLRPGLCEYQLAIKRHTRHFTTHRSVHVHNNYGHEFSFDNVEILDGERKYKEYQRRIPRSLSFRSVSQSVSQSAIHRCIDIDPIHQPMRKVMNDRKVRGEAEEQPTGKSTKSVNDTTIKGDNQSPTSWSGQATKSLTER
ncbi:unnamed protein product, partial [Heterobilharzia americana]